MILGFCCALVAAACLCAATAAAAGEPRGATLDDVLAMRAFGSGSLSPHGEWVVYEREAPYRDAPRFDRGLNTASATAEIMIAAAAGGTPEPLLPSDEGWAYRLGPWSPDGAHLVVYRWKDQTAEAGVVRLSDRQAEWTGLTPDLPMTGVGAAWADAHRLALTTRPAGDLPWRLRLHDTGAEEKARRWTRTALGRTPSRLAVETEAAALRPDIGPMGRRLVMIDVSSGGRAAVAEGAIRDIAPSPDGRWAAVLMEAEPAPLRPEERVIQTPILRRTRLTILDLATGRSVGPHPALDIAPHLLRWSADSQRVLIWGRRDGDAWKEGVLAAMDLQGGLQTFNVGGLEPNSPGRPLDETSPPRADWLGDHPIVRARAGASDRFDWWSVDSEAPPMALTAGLRTPPDRLAAVDDVSALYFADGALWRTGADGRTARADREQGRLGDGGGAPPRTPLRQGVNSPPKRAWAVARLEGGLAGLTETGSTLWRSETPCEGADRVLDSTASGALIRCVENGMETLRLIGTTGERLLERLNTHLAARPLARARAVAHRDWRGLSVESYLYLPPDVTASAVKGVFVHVYPGGVYDGRYVDGASVRAAISPQLLAAGGYAVLSAYLPALTGEEGDARFDVLTQGADLAIDALLAAEPDLSDKPLILAGHSFGGYAALGIATRSRRFGAIVAWAAPTDMISHWGELLSHARLWPQDALSFAHPIGYAETGQGRMGAPPWEALDLYAAASPALLADRIRTPVLLITADGDYVSHVQAARMFAALYRLGKPARLVEYWGEEHDNASPANLRDAYDEIFRWAERASARQPRLPGPNPALERRQRQDLAVAAPPGEALAGEVGVERGAVE